MKILVLGDPHGKLPPGLTGIIKRNKVELIVCVGDLHPTPKNPNSLDQWNKSRDKLEKLFRKVMKDLFLINLPIILLRGNMNLGGKPKKYFDELCDRYGFIRGRTRKVKIKDEKFILFDMIYEEHSTLNLNQFVKNRMKANHYKKRKLSRSLEYNSILISHVPPYGILDVVHNKYTNFKNKHVGSKIIQEEVFKTPPKLVLFGHIHESKGKKKIGKTLFINCGEKGDYLVVDTKTNKILESNFLK